MREAMLETVRGSLSTAVIGDVLDTMGYRRQFLPQEIRPLPPEMKVVGIAMPVLESDVFDDSDPFGLLFEALDSLQRGEVYIATGGSRSYAMWGELMTVVAQGRGAAGAVLHGPIRDTQQVLSMDFPVFATGSYAQDQRGRGRVLAYRTPVEFGGVRIEPGDILAGDTDGVLVIPSAVAEDCIHAAMEKVAAEDKVRAALKSGMSSAEAFRTFGVM